MLVRVEMAEYEAKPGLGRKNMKHNSLVLTTRQQLKGGSLEMAEYEAEKPGLGRINKQQKSNSNHETVIERRVTRDINFVKLLSRRYMCQISFWVKHAAAFNNFF